MLDRSVAPPIQKISKLDITKVETKVLPNGIPVHFLNAGKHDIIKSEFILRSGKWYEENPGTSYFASKMLLEGTNTNNSQQLSEAFQSLGAHIDINPESDLVSLSVYVLRKNLEKALLLIKECFLESTIPENEFKILKDIRSDQIRINEKKNSYVASRILRKEMFGAHHPYGRTLLEKDIENLVHRGKVREYYEKKLLNGIEIIISGKVGASTLKLLNVFSDMPFRQSEDKKYVVETLPARIEENRPESLQTSLRIARRIVPKNHPDHFGLVILNEILGGYFGSRLMKNIREEKGFTYGIHSTLLHYLKNDLWLIGADVRKEFRDPAVEEIFTEFKRLREEPVGKEELDTVKNYMLGSFLMSLETSFSLAGKFKQIHLFDLNYDFYDRYIETVNTIDASTLQDLANVYLDDSKFSVVMVG